MPTDQILTDFQVICRTSGVCAEVRQQPNHEAAARALQDALVGKVNYVGEAEFIVGTRYPDPPQTVVLPPHNGIIATFGAVR